MAKGVGTPRIIKGVKYYPIYEHYKNRKIVNTMVKADSEAEARRILKDRVAEYFKNSIATTGEEVSLEVAREELRKDLSDLTNEKDRKYLWKNTFTRLFIDFPKHDKISISSCLNLPKGYFKKYKYYFCVILKRENGWRAEIIRIKAMIERLKGLGRCSEDDLKQVREQGTPEGIPIPPPKVSDKQIEELFAYTKKYRPDYYRPIKFMHLVGRRPKEVCNILQDDVTMEGLNPISIQTKPKTAKIKTILPKPIYLDDPELNLLIRSALANNKTKWLFPTVNGKKMLPNDLWKYLSAISDKIIGTRLTSKGFRKLFLTKSNNDGLNFTSMDMANITSVAVMKKHYVGSVREAQAVLLAKNRGIDV